MPDPTLRFVPDHFAREPKPLRAARATRDVLPFPPGGVFGTIAQPAASGRPQTAIDAEHLERTIDAMQRKLDELTHHLDEQERSFRLTFEEWEGEPPQAA